MTKKKILTNEEITEARKSATEIKTDPIDAQDLKEPTSENPWELPFHMADYMTPKLIQGFKDYEKERKEFMQACGVSELTGAERSLSMMIVLCFMNLDELDQPAFRGAFEYVRNMVLEITQKAKAANIVRDSMN